MSDIEKEGQQEARPEAAAESLETQEVTPVDVAQTAQAAERQVERTGEQEERAIEGGVAAARDLGGEEGSKEAQIIADRELAETRAAVQGTDSEIEGQTVEASGESKGGKEATAAEETPKADEKGSETPAEASGKKESESSAPEDLTAKWQGAQREMYAAQRERDALPGRVEGNKMFLSGNPNCWFGGESSITKPDGTIVKVRRVGGAYQQGRWVDDQERPLEAGVATELEAGLGRQLRKEVEEYPQRMDELRTKVDDLKMKEGRARGEMNREQWEREKAKRTEASGSQAGGSSGQSAESGATATENRSRPDGPLPRPPEAPPFYRGGADFGRDAYRDTNLFDRFVGGDPRASEMRSRAEILRNALLEKGEQQHSFLTMLVRALFERIQQKLSSDLERSARLKALERIASRLDDIFKLLGGQLQETQKSESRG